MSEKATQLRPNRSAATEAPVPPSWADFAREEQEDRRIRRWSIGIALTLHLGLAAVLGILGPLPTAGNELEPAKLLVAIPEVRFEPEPPPPPTEVPERPPLRVPIPDPTPDDPEPVRIREEIEPEGDLLSVDLDVLVIPEPPPVEPHGPIPVGGEVRAPVRISGPDPVYPELAHRVGVEGTVTVKAIVNRQGTVEHAKVVKGLGWGLDEAAVSAIKRWRFEPATLNGRPVDVFYSLTVNFRID